MLLLMRQGFLREQAAYLETIDLANLPNADGEIPKSSWQNTQIQLAKYQNGVVENANCNNESYKKPNKKSTLLPREEIQKIIEGEKLNLDIEIFYKWYEAEMNDKGLKGSLLNVMRSMAEKPRNQIKVLPVPTDPKQIKLAKERDETIKEIEGQIKFFIGNKHLFSDWEERVKKLELSLNKS